MKKLILWLGICALMVIALTACGSGPDLPFTNMVFGGEGSVPQETPEADESQSAYDFLGRPIPTDMSVEESNGEAQ